MARIDSFLKLVTEQRASDLHFHAGNPPIIRYDGELVPLPFRTLGKDETRRFLMEIMSPAQRQHFEEFREIDFLYELKGIGRFRTNCMEQSHGLGAVFRIIPPAIPTLDELSMPPVIKRLTQMQNGLVLVCGPTGSGKTTTLAAMIQEINTTEQKHILTIEDPIEFIHPRIKGTVTQRQVGLHCESFASALRASLRESPDVLVVGEMRDEETISLALAAAETGVLVFGTLHTNTAAKAVDRIIDVIPEESRDQLRGSLSVLLRAVVAQQLCRRANQDGRIAGIEVLLQNFAVSHMIRSNKVHQIEGYLETASNDGSGQQSLDAHLFRLVRDGMVEIDEALSVANQPHLLEKRVAEMEKDTTA